MTGHKLQPATPVTQIVRLAHPPGQLAHAPIPTPDPAVNQTAHPIQIRAQATGHLRLKLHAEDHTTTSMSR